MSIIRLDGGVITHRSGFRLDCGVIKGRHRSGFRLDCGVIKGRHRSGFRLWCDQGST